MLYCAEPPPATQPLTLIGPAQPVLDPKGFGPSSVTHLPSD